MKLENVTLEEVRSFLNSLTVEEKYFPCLRDAVMSAEFITGVRINNELAGIGGITLSCRFFPLPFWVVKSEFQKKGIGYQLSENIIDFARNRYSFLLLHVMKENIPAVKLYQKTGFRTCYEAGDRYRMYLPLNRKGSIMCRFLPLIYMVYLSPLGKVLEGVRHYRSKFKTKD